MEILNKKILSGEYGSACIEEIVSDTESAFYAFAYLPKQDRWFATLAEFNDDRRAVYERLLHDVKNSLATGVCIEDKSEDVEKAVNQLNEQKEI